MAEIKGRKVINFSAGPSMLPDKVLDTIESEMKNLPQEPGCSLIEISHRSKAFDSILVQASKRFSELTKTRYWPNNKFIKDEVKYCSSFKEVNENVDKLNHTVNWMTGGGTAQFDAVVYNLLGQNQKYSNKKPLARYLVNGIWSKKAFECAERLTKPLTCEAKVEKYVLDSTFKESTDEKESLSLKNRLLEISKLLLSKPSDDDYELRYIYYCDNETVHGIEFCNLLKEALKETLKDMKHLSQLPLLVIDFSSNVCSWDYPKGFFDEVAVAFGGSQKNLGPSGVTIALVRDDVSAGLYKDDIEDPNIKGLGIIPLLYDYELFSSNRSVYNTPPSFSIYGCGLVLKWLQETCFSSEFNLLADFLISNKNIFESKFGLSFLYSNNENRESIIKTLINDTEDIIIKSNNSICTKYCVICNKDVSLPLKSIETLNLAKSKLIYNLIKGSNGFYSSPVTTELQSRMNIVIKINGKLPETSLNKTQEEQKQELTQLNNDLTNLFVSEAKTQHLIQLAGHRSVGGIRASLYNAMPIAGVIRLVEFMTGFHNRTYNK